MMALKRKLLTTAFILFGSSFGVLVDVVHSFSHSYTVSGYSSSCNNNNNNNNNNVNEAYQKCLVGWRDENFQLPINPPIILSRGNEQTGVGFELCRIPPFGLREAIVDCYSSSNDGTSKQQQQQQQEGPHKMTMIYKITNPGWLTFPVKEHEGEVIFVEEKDGKGTRVEWTVRWTPLPFASSLVEASIQVVVNRILKYVCQ